MRLVRPYDFIEELRLLDGSGKVIEARPNQKSTWSDGSGSGFMYNWMLSEVPARVCFRFKMFGKIEAVKLPFRVTADIDRD